MFIWLSRIETLHPDVSFENKAETKQYYWSTCSGA